MAGIGRKGSPAAGRQKGTPNKDNQPLWEALRALGYREGTQDDPGVFLWLIMTGRQRFERHLPVMEDGQQVGSEKVLEPAPLEARQKAADRLMDRKYPMLRAIEHSGQVDGDLRVYFGVDNRTLGGDAAPRPAPTAAARPVSAAVLKPPKQPLPRGRAPRPE